MVASSSSTQVLVVEDDPAIGNLIVDIISEAGYRVALVTTGHAALALVSESHPQLIILDIELPDMDGYSVYDELKMNGMAEAMNVLFMSAGRWGSEMPRPLTPNFLTKPFKIDDLLEMVSGLAGSSQRA